MSSEQQPVTSIPLHIAVAKQNLAEIRSLLAGKADVNVVDDFGRTALHLAAANKNLDIANALLEYKADVHKKDQAGKAPLPTILAIIDQANVYQPLASNPLHLAVAQKDLDQVRLLLAGKADVNSNANGRTALKIAVRQKGTVPMQILKELLAAKANLTTPATDLHPPLFLAARSENAEVVRLLIDAKADVNHSNLLGETALHLLSTYTNLDTINVLLEHKADVNKKTVAGQAPLLTMLDQAKDDDAAYLSIARLIEVRADVNVQDGSDNRFLIKALVHYGPKKLIDLIKTTKPDIDPPTLQSLLDAACRQGNPEMVTTLLDCKANINGEHIERITPFTQALRVSRITPLAQLLISIERNVECIELMAIFSNPDDAQRTYLLCPGSKHLQVLDLLIKKKANINHRNDRGEPMMLRLAINTFLPEAVHMLLAAKANPFDAGNTSLCDKEIRKIIEQAQQQKRQCLSFLAAFHQRTGARAAISPLQKHSLFERQLPRLILSLAGTKPAASATDDAPTKSI